MCGTLLLAAVGIVLTLTRPGGAQDGAAIGERPLALALFSYHPGYAITDGMLQGLQEALSDLPGVDLRIEYMDAQRFPAPEHLEHLRRLYGAKYGDAPLAAMVVCDDIGLDFVLAHRSELFRNAPLVFCGVNDFEPARIAGHSAITGVNEAPDMVQTLELALSLHPQARRVVAISDQTLTGQINRRRFERDHARFEDRVAIEHWIGLSRAEMDSRLGSLTGQDIVLYLSWLLTPGGRTLSVTESVSFIALRSAAPVYSCWDFVIHNGALGGRVISGQEQGRTAGRMLRRILEGETADAIPVRMESPNQYLFNHTQMERFGLRAEQIPRESMVYPDTRSHYGTHSYWLWEAVVFLLLLATLVFFLVVNLLRRLRAEQAQGDAERLLRALMEAIPAPIFSKDTLGRYQIANQMFANLILGKPPDKIAGKTLDDLAAVVPADLREHNLSRDQTLLSAGGLQVYETQAQCSDGKRRDFLMRKTLLTNAAGEATGIVGVMLDLTELKDTQRRLMALERRMQQLSRTSPNYIVILDSQGIIRFVNHPAEGYTEAQVVGYSWFAFVERLDLPAMRQAFEKVIRQGATETLEWRGVRQGGAPDWYMTVMGPDYDDGLVSGAVLINMNISDRKKAEQQLQNNESRLRAMFDNHPAGLIVIRLRDRAILSVNPTLLDLLGYDEHDLLHHSVLDFAAPEDRTLVADLLAERQAGRNDVTTCEMRLLRKSGPPLWVQNTSSVYPIGADPAVLSAVVSIAERKEWEAALREEGRRLRQALEHLPVLLDVLNADGAILAWNLECERVTGYQREEIIGNPDAIALLYPDPTYRQAMMKRFLALKGDFRDEETQITCRNGEQRTIAWSSIACQAPIPGWETWAIGVDLTDRRKAEQALRQSENRLRAMMAQAPIGIAIADTDGVVLEANDALAAIIGYEPQDLRGVSFEAITHPDDLPREWEAIGLVLDAKIPFYRIEKRYLHRDGSIVWVDVLSATIRGETDQDDFCFAFVQDITDRRTAQEALAASEREKALVLNALSEVVVYLDCDLRVLWLNRSAEQLLQTHAGSAIDTHCYAFWHGRTEPCDPCCVRQSLEDGRLHQHETTVADGSTWLITSQAVHDSDGKIIGALKTALDITDRKKIEQERLESERQRQHTRKLESLGVLSGGMAHDFNNLLMSILGNADLAMRQVPPGSRTRRNLEDIESASRRAADLCAQMLAYSGKGQLVIAPLDCNALLEELTPMLRGSTPRQVRLAIAPCHDPAPTIRGDASQIRQVIMNLFINACEALGETPGDITIALDVVHCESADLANPDIPVRLPTGPYVRLRVSDTGCGMAPETQEHIFDPFFTTKFVGRGLGLAAVLGIVRAHGGSLKVFSEHRQGATFTIYLPLRAPADSAPEPDRNAPEAP